ncbi:hypothetical protein [Fibrobacter sp.]|uniref:hypothetical protein n=1 Tax=Fibrobacter sp. TaxID=35828 RepID=UPI0038635F29
MAVMIDGNSVVRLFENNLFDYDKDRQLMLYNENGLSLEFSVPWLSLEVGKTYDLAKVRAALGEMMRNVSHTEAIRKKMDDPKFTEMLSKEMTAFGMQHIQDTETFAYEEDGKYLFGVELEYIVSLLVINEGETVTSLLTAMRDDARGKRDGKKTEEAN